MLSNKNQLDPLSQTQFTKIIRQNSFKNTEGISENFKIKSIPMIAQITHSCRPHNIKIKKIANKIETNREILFKNNLKNNVREMRSASPKHEISITSQDQEEQPQFFKTKRRNEILLSEKYKELEEIWKKKNIYDKNTIELCFDILYCLFQCAKSKDLENNMEVLSAVFRKLLFFDDEIIQQKIEVSFGKFIAFSGETYKDLVEILCSFNSESKRIYEEQNKLLIQENLNLKKNLDIQKCENSKILNNYLNVESTVKEIYDKEIKKYEEKYLQNNLYLQKILNENARMRNIYKNENENLLTEKQKLEHCLKQNVSNLALQLEKMNHNIDEHEKERFESEYFKDKAILDFQTMLTSLKESRDKISNFKSQISNITKENNLLKKRGDLSLEEFTPRPSFNQFKEILNVAPSFFENKSTKILVDDLFLEYKANITKIYSYSSRKDMTLTPTTPNTFTKKNDNPFHSETSSPTLRLDQNLKESEREKVEKIENLKTYKKNQYENEKTENMIKTKIKERRNLPKVNILTGVNEIFKNKYSKKLIKESPSGISLKHHIIELKLE